ncbi:hypothetical protein A2X44_01480 [candidate division CPR3 bacterium GWF2_35_18]|nr:MAG: hypothetical protein A2X44_01480 [candidate division CPR3 bacterium GWF2_35_18]OGB64683.1 MAG: hypothetical protein A2250_04030 [candidate division CPR3 bacterium RIFOXYA2_FULL_35_13]OGB79881.1 MAG: hypothetical protein A2011_01540 [candidate division CPR3 bacterium GWE2_35_7]
MHSLGRRAKIQGETRERQFLDEMGIHFSGGFKVLPAYRSAGATFTHNPQITKPISSLPTLSKTNSKSTI